MRILPLLVAVCLAAVRLSAADVEVRNYSLTNVLVFTDQEAMTLAAGATLHAGSPERAGGLFYVEIIDTGWTTDLYNESFDAAKGKLVLIIGAEGKVWVEDHSLSEVQMLLKGLFWGAWIMMVGFVYRCMSNIGRTSPEL